MRHPDTPVGRKGFLKQVRHINSTIEHDDYEFVLKLGNNNVSAGLRKIIGEFRKKSKELSN